MFEPGDKVKCIDSYRSNGHGYMNSIKEGHIYTVKEYEPDGYVKLEEFEGSFYPRRFEKICLDPIDTLKAKIIEEYESCNKYTSQVLSAILKDAYGISTNIKVITTEKITFSDEKNS